MRAALHEWDVCRLVAKRCLDAAVLVDRGREFIPPATAGRPSDSVLPLQALATPGSSRVLVLVYCCKLATVKQH